MATLPSAAGVLVPPGYALGDEYEYMGYTSQEMNEFAFTALTPGAYSITLTFGERVEYVDDVQVQPGATAMVDRQVDWETGFNETVTVYAASRRLERIVDAPAAVTSLSSETVRLEAASGQVPRASIRSMVKPVSTKFP